MIVTGTKFNDSIDVMVRDDGATIAVQTGDSAGGPVVNIPIQVGAAQRDFVALGDVKAIRIDGDRGNDTLSNSTGVPSRIFGGDDNDRLYGGSGNDYLDGGKGDDYLDGGGGDDGLFGGMDSQTDPGIDTLLGGDGADRLYSHTFYGGAGEETIDVVTRTDSDAIIFLSDNLQNNTTFEQTLPGTKPDAVKITPGSWTAAQVEALNDVLAVAQARTNNTVLLQQLAGFPVAIDDPHKGEELFPSVTFRRVGGFFDLTTGKPDTQSGYNRGGVIYLPDVTISPALSYPLLNEAARAKLTFLIVHELGHFRDNESGQDWEEFKKLSGWSLTGVSEKDKGKFADDVQWQVEKSTADQFLRDYSGKEPYDDFADTFSIAVLFPDGPPGIPFLELLTSAIGQKFRWSESIGKKYEFMKRYLDGLRTPPEAVNP